MVDVAEVEVIYATYHVDVGETPFYVALDYTKKKVSRVSSLICMHRTEFPRETTGQERLEAVEFQGPLNDARSQRFSPIADINILIRRTKRRIRAKCCAAGISKC